MLRYYFSSNDLNEIEHVEHELEDDGFSKHQIHVLSENEAELDKRHIHSVPSIFKSDGIHWAERGAIVGLVAAAVAVMLLISFELHTLIGMPTIVLIGFIVFGAFTWEAGLIGMQKPNYKFQRFQAALSRGEHVLMVDAKDNQVNSLNDHMRGHPKLVPLGTGSAFVSPFD